MKYVSTRGGVAPAPFTQVVLEGLMLDGGLAMPEQTPKIDEATLEVWRFLSYQELAVEVIKLFATDIPVADLKAMVMRAYTPEKFGNPLIVPVSKLAPGLHLAHLSNGPTLAFKDMAMQLLGELFEYVLAQRNQVLNILGATSGDTGSAAEYAMRGRKGVSVFMLSPHDRMSAFQRAQMFSLPDANIHNIAVRGVFDDCQDMVKYIGADAAFKQRWHIGTVNSINWARLLAQIVYYVRSYFAVTSHNGQRISFCVPSGNFGNICAGHIAKRMGLPIDQLVLATNENNVLDEFFRTGIYRPRGSAQTYQTSSPSMDISKASNFERFVFDLVGRDAAKLRALWADLDRQGYFDIAQHGLKDALPQYGFVSGTSTHARRLACIAQWAQQGVLVDPHTADGLNVAVQHQKSDVPMVVLETALPTKFEETMVEATGKKPPRPAGLEQIESLPQRVQVIDNDVNAVRALIEQHALK